MNIIVNGLLEFVYHMVILLVFKSVIIHLIEGTKYEKYVRVSGGFLLLLLIISFVITMKNQGNVLKNIIQEMEFDMESGDMIPRMKSMDERVENVILQEYQGQNEEQEQDKGEIDRVVIEPIAVESDSNLWE